MTVTADYLRYPERRAGLDHRWFEHRSISALPPIRWPTERRVALWLTVHLEFFPMNMTGQPIRPPGAMDRAYPDFWGFTHRDYGNRVGIYRIMRVLDQLGLRATAAMNSAVATRYPSLVKEIVKRGWEVMASGTDMAHLHHGGMKRDDEAKLVHESVTTLRRATGGPISGWHSPVHSESMNTLDLVAAEGIEYVADWINDDLPYQVKIPSGSLCALPLTHERSDSTMLLQYQQSMSEYEAHHLAAFRQLDKESESHGGRILSIAVRPWIMGQPHRIRTFERVVAAIARSPSVWPATGVDILRALGFGK